MRFIRNVYGTGALFWLAHKLRNMTEKKLIKSEWRFKTCLIGRQFLGLTFVVSSMESAEALIRFDFLGLTQNCSKTFQTSFKNSRFCLILTFWKQWMHLSAILSFVEIMSNELVTSSCFLLLQIKSIGQVNILSWNENFKNHFKIKWENARTREKEFHDEISTRKLWA